MSKNDDGTQNLNEILSYLKYIYLGKISTLYLIDIQDMDPQTHRQVKMFQVFKQDHIYLKKNFTL